MENRIRRIEQSLLQYQAWARDVKRRMFWMQLWLAVLIIPPFALLALWAAGKVA
jgi:hypothetical protein